MIYRLVLIRCCAFLSLALLLMRCGRSDLSMGAVTDPSLLQVNIVVHRRVCYDGNSSNIKAYLKDQSGNTVVNRAIQIRVNGRPLRLNSGSSNYYGAFPFYELSVGSDESVRGGETYVFTLILTDGKEYEVGRIQAHPDLTTRQLALPPDHSRKKPLQVNWQGVEPGNYWLALWKRWQGETTHSQMTVSKVNETKNQWGSLIEEDGSADQADYITIDVGTGSGSHLIPVSYLKGPKARFNALSLMLTSIKTIKITESFRAGSDITSEHSTFYRVNVID
jgi:hypothetical protein